MSTPALNEELQYQKRLVTLRLSFRINAATTPDTLRDGKAGYIQSVARTSAGLFTITFKPLPLLPKQLTYASAHISMSATPTKFCRAWIVRDSYNVATRVVQVATASLDGTPAVEDPDDNDIIRVILQGPASNTFKDPA